MFHVKHYKFQKNSIIKNKRKKLLDLIKKTNEYTHQFGLSLSDHDIKELMIKHKECLLEHQRPCIWT